MALLEIDNLHVSYGRVEVLHGISLYVDEGEIVTLLGANGAGKSTTLLSISRLVTPDSGRVVFDGMDLSRYQSHEVVGLGIAQSPEGRRVFGTMTVEENLRFFASVFGTTVEQNYDLVRPIYAQLEPFRRRRAGKLSGGMKQKLALSCALIHAPRVLLLDEPTTGVDPVSRKEFWQMLLKLRSDHGITVLVSTPYMDEASWCDRISLVQDGRLLRTDTPDGVCRAYSGKLYAVRCGDMRRLTVALKGSGEVESAFAFGDSFHVTLRPGATVGALRDGLAAVGLGQVDIREISPSVEDCFMALMGNSTADAHLHPDI